MSGSIDNKEFKEKLESGEYTLIDLRTPEETALGKILEESKEFDFHSPNFRLMLDTLSKDSKYLIYCAHGNRSKKVLALMKSLEFLDVFELNAGIANYSF